MKILTFTTFYPNQIIPQHGLTVKNRFDHLDKIDGFSRTVISPLPHCPLIRKFSDRYKKYEEHPNKIIQGNINIHYPKYVTYPGISFFDIPSSMVKAAEEALSDISDVDIIDAQCLYPDGVAAFKIAKQHNKPLILTAHGDDVYDHMENKKTRKQIIKAIEYATTVICISNNLKESLLEHGIDENKIAVIPNGVDTGIFNPEVQANTVRGEYYLSVGSLSHANAHDITLSTFYELLKTRLIIVGNGEERRSLKKQAIELGIQRRVQFIHYLDQAKLAEFYAGATATILMAPIKGLPNAAMESIAVGTPVIATNAGGTPEVVNKDNGILLRDSSEYALLNAIDQISELENSRYDLASSVKHYCWKEAAKKQFRIYMDAV